MRKKLFLVAIAAISLFATGFYILNNEIEKIREKVLTNLFYVPNSYYPIDSFPDQSLKISVNDYGRTSDAYAVNTCGWSVSYMYYQFYIAMDSNAYWNYASFSYDNDFRNNYKKNFKYDILKSQFKSPAGDHNDPGSPSFFHYFDGAGMESAFNLLYLKPTDKFKGLEMQKIYDVSLKAYLRDVARVMMKVKANNTSFVSLANEYVAKAKSDKKFEGQIFSHNAALKLLGKDFKTQCFGREESPERVVGIMLRRQADGTLPVLIKCFKKILLDYDPAFYKEVSEKI